MTTPQNPYQTPQDGAAPNPYAAPTAAPDASVPPQGYPQPAPGQPVPPQGYAAPPAAGYAAPPAPAKPSVGARAGRAAGFAGMRIVVSLVILAVVGGGYWIYDHATGGADTAKAGDCVVNKGTDSNPDVHTISCSDPSAKYKVLKVVSGTNTNACDGVPGATVTYYQSGGHTDDVVLCLGDNS